MPTHEYPQLRRSAACSGLRIEVSFHDTRGTWGEERVLMQIWGNSKTQQWVPRSGADARNAGMVQIENLTTGSAKWDLNTLRKQVSGAEAGNTNNGSAKRDIHAKPTASREAAQLWDSDKKGSGFREAGLKHAEKTSLGAEAGNTNKGSAKWDIHAKPTASREAAQLWVCNDREKGSAKRDLYTLKTYLIKHRANERNRSSIPHSIPPQGQPSCS